MTKTKLTPCRLLEVINGEVECIEKLPETPPYTRLQCPKKLQGLYNVGEPYVPCNKCLFLGKYQNDRFELVRDKDRS